MNVDEYAVQVSAAGKGIEGFTKARRKRTRAWTLR
jgi:hypothetical protein